MKQWKDRPTRPEPNPTFRWATMWLEHVACAVLMWFPMVRLEYLQGYVSEEQPLSYFVKGMAWEIPHQVLQMAFVAVVAASALPLFAKQIPKKPILIALLSVSAASVLANLTLFFVTLALSGGKTYGGFPIQYFPTIPGLLYVVFAVFAVIETIATARALHRERAPAQEPLCEQEEETSVED